MVDITDCFKEKLRAIRAYRSQFGQTAKEQGILPLSIDDYIFHIESRCRFYGSLIDVKYGEAFLAPARLKCLIQVYPLLSKTYDLKVIESSISTMPSLIT